MTTTYGYLSLPYLMDPYLAGVTRKTVASQVELVIFKDHFINSQTTAKVFKNHGYLSQVDLNVETARSVLNQVELRVVADHAFGSQVNLETSQDHVFGAQVDRKILAERTLGNQVTFGVNLHEHCEDYGYLRQPYLKMQYLSDYICVHQRSQVDRKIGTEHAYGSQVEHKILKDHAIASQVLSKIYKDKPFHSQVTFIKAHRVGSQVRAVLYNTTNLRILCDFPSRGVDSGAGNNAWGNPVATGLNWVANSTAAGDFDVSNLNTDIVEQVWRSNGTIAGLELKCDTEISQGVFLDTFAILGHNFTISASIQLQGSTTSNFATVNFSTDLNVIRNHDNIYYIAPNLPTTSYRYWRVLVTDVTNTDGYLQVGTIVFGSSIIFQGECFVDQVSRSTKHFSDKVETEGFTNVSNDRALKYAVGLDFRSLRYNRGNYNNIRGVFDYARTSLKCLWIPTPQYPQRFAVFGKLPQIPSETHNVKGENLDFVDFSIEVDESL